MQWNPTLSQSARKDGAPVGGLGCRRSGSKATATVTDKSVRPTRAEASTGAVESHPFAKCAKGWGTRRWFRVSAVRFKSNRNGTAMATDKSVRPTRAEASTGAVESPPFRKVRERMGHPSVV